MLRAVRSLSDFLLHIVTVNVAVVYFCEFYLVFTRLYHSIWWQSSAFCDGMCWHNIQTPLFTLSLRHTAFSAGITTGHAYEGEKPQR